MNFTDKQIEAYLSGVFSGKYSASAKLPKDLYSAIAEHLMSGLDKGIGNVEFGKKNEGLLKEFRENIYMFSGAKTYQQVREMGNFIADSSSYAEFKDKALGVYNQYNKDWLRAEYNTAYGQGTIANQWQKIHAEKDTFPLLRYSAVMDLNTSEECRGFDGITLPVDDKFWDNYSPLNHFNCRCVLQQIDKYSNTKESTPKEREAAMNVGKEGVDDVFTMNPYKDGYVFSPEHPYFKVAPKDVKFAQQNFDLPIPQQEFNYNSSQMGLKDIRTAITEMFAKNGNLKSVATTSKLSLKEARERLDSLQDLMNEYKIVQPQSKWGVVEVEFQSNNKVYGSVSRYSDDYSLAKINFGDIGGRLDSRLFVEGGTTLRAKSAVDAKNIGICTQVHEFAHVLSVEGQAVQSYATEGVKDFWKKINKMKKEYQKELLSLQGKGDKVGLYKVHLGDYAMTNRNEFMAEAFTEYKLSSNPSKYAKQVGELIDATFKK